MSAVNVFLVVYAVVWGGLLAALLGWLAYNIVLEALASVWPVRFEKTALRVRRRMRQKIRRRQRELGRDYFNRTHGPQFADACRDTIELILSSGPDYFRKNGLRSPREAHRPRRYR
ncbi:MAG TPA: hypothetical protein P5279_17475 [Anaerohalosphaeraceae bacterium]|jgi:hypothetical protein|nr:hypothetical protein [Anaerohalosphaeraceae bacterium]HRT52284.1 hypothetical protein [Anaerohalosphaeraceae bacterium]HRT88393.1 hypothetical protein [Anaerohalosphaeraceae bacterium]